MNDSFRFEPPEPRADAVVRRRLLRTLVGRWERRVTVLTGGAGLGKTTLLAQMVAENRLVPRGEDVWVSLRRLDADGDRLARLVAAAVGGGEARDALWAGEAVTPRSVAEVVWQRAPVDTCIVIDDVHLVPADSTGAAWLTGLAEALPANGHLVLASRLEPPVPLARLSAQGAVLRVVESDLRFDEGELAAFAARRGVEVLAFLIAHRRTTRAAIEAALWPEHGPRSAANNLNVTLNHLRRALEPGRDPKEPSHLLRLDGPGVALVTGDGLRIDVDDFDEHLRAAAQAETDGVPSVALDHDLAAIDLYRGDLHPELPEVEWLSLDREHYRAGLVAAAVRASELLLGRGEPDHAETVARRALEVDTCSEGAYAVLITSALGRGDRATAQCLLDHCAKSLATLGLNPSAAIEQLQRRIHHP